MVESKHQRLRSNSFADIDEVQASGILNDVFEENNVLLGGSSIGKGFKRAARRYLFDHKEKNLEILKHPDLIPDQAPLEEAFYVVDLGIVVSQVYQWRRYFPRVQPFYAVKCNPDPVIVKTLAILGCNFDCASAKEIDIVQSVCRDIPQKPEILYANPCKARNHLIHAVTHGVRMVTFDNVQEVNKIASISKKIQLILRIVTDDRGSQCRLSSKFGAPKARWRNLLQAAKDHGLPVIGVSFHVGSGCRDASRYEMALKDCRELFDMAKEDFGFDMNIVDIGGGFPGETHSFWNPEVLDSEDDEDEDEEVAQEIDEKEGVETNSDKSVADDTTYMFFTEIAEAVAPMIDALFPPDVRVIGEPGRYFVAAAATLVTSVVGARSNELDEKKFVPEPISDADVSREIYERSREAENAIVHNRGTSFGVTDERVWNTIEEELSDYAKYFTKQNFVTQETDAYNDGLDLYDQDFNTAADLLGMPDEKQQEAMIRSVEGMTRSVATGGCDQGFISLAAAGEAAINGVVLQAVADSAPLQDDFAYYVNDGVYGAFNNLMFDHATVRPRVLRVFKQGEDREYLGSMDIHTDLERLKDQNLYASTVFGPTCDSIDVIARSVLLPKLKIGDWLYFQNMGAYTMAAASQFNGFPESQKMYVCSVQPEYFEGLIAGPEVENEESGKVSDIEEDDEEEKKDDAL